ncbi:Protein of uncharacterised function (DUF3077) [Pseudomonas putida]|uniref:Protein of uncharacterized function (DUF3077) n=1 Tax=Pseudomonas putida TaxID=303 RepID=A0A379KQV7_PSEPU|nr:Protein of uncharacterised function (DUF3077) [Pseudomonas putida]
MPKDSTTEKTTPGKTMFYQAEGQTQPLFCIAHGIPCQSAKEQASELMGSVRVLTITGLEEENPQWTVHGI